MNGERDTEVIDDVDDVEENASPEDTVVLTEDLADIGDLADTAELDVDKLVAKLDTIDDAEHRKEVHRRLEELAERKREQEELDSTYNFNLDDEV
jgi:inactivated superfamily I helicase